MKFFKAKKHSILLNILRYSFVGVFIFAISLSSFFSSNLINTTKASGETLTVVSTTSNSVTLKATGLAIGSTYRINIFNTGNVLKTHWDLNTVATSTVTTTSPSTPPLTPDTYVAKISDGTSYIANSDSFTISTIPPKIISFSPASGKVGETVTITGENFTGVSKVLFGEIANAIPVTNSATVITVLVPRVAVTGTLHVITDHGTASSETDFVFIPNENKTATCSDGIKNQDETGIDTGGVCSTQVSGGTTKPKPKIEFHGIVPVCNTGVIDPVTKNYANACDFNMVMTLINQVINFLLVTMATPLFALIIIYVGWLYLSDMGSAENIKKAKSILKNAVIGYVIALAAWLIVKTILVTVGFDPKDAYLAV